jgi:acyl-CoA synthetase (AMP-forming)/AMP-acid ligase II/thioesterase domain-containing protein
MLAQEKYREKAAARSHVRMASDLSLPVSELRGSARGSVRTAAHLRTIPAALARRAAGAGHAPALVGVGSEVVTFSQLLASIRAVARDLANAGLRREDRVGLLVPPGVKGGQLVVALASNVTLVPVNPALTARETVDLVRMGKLDAFVIPQWLETPARSAILEHGTTVLVGVLAIDGTLSFEPLTPAPEASTALRPALETDCALLLRSSGTTGAPKLIPVTHGNLLAMAGRLGSDFWFHLTSHDRAACALPLYYAAGLKTSLFVPLLLGASVAIPPAGRAFDLGEWIDILKPTYLSTSPGALNGVLDQLRASGRDFDRGSLRFVMCAAAYLPEGVRLAAQSLLQVPVLEFYGLSEAGIMAANPAPPGRIKPGTVGLPAPGELLIVDEARKPVARGTTGNIMISGPTVMPGYLVTDGSDAGELKDGWLLTGDLGCIDEDGYLTIVGREKEVINRGGEKVFPYEVEKALLEHPAVLEAAVYGVPHPRLGESVAAAVVTKPSNTVSEQALKKFLTGRLATYKWPRTVSLLAELPRGNTGKVLRSALSQAHAANRREVVLPDRLLELELRDIWQSLLDTDDIGIDDDFFEIGGDSLLAARLLTDVENLAARPYPQSELSTLTIRHMAEVLTSGIVAKRALVTQAKSGSGVPLFFCHGDYVSRGIYAQKLAALVPNDQPVYLLHCYADHLPGSSIEEIANTYLHEVVRIAPASPVVVGGYCNGGLAAWHLAHLLRLRGVEVTGLFLVETMSLNARPGLRMLARLFRQAGAVLPGRVGRYLREDAMPMAWFWKRRLGGLTWRAVGDRIWSARRRPAPLGPRRDAFEAAAEAYLALMAKYVPPRLDIGVTCFIAEEGRQFDTEPGSWGRLAARVGKVIVPGTHLTALVAGRQALGLALGAALEQSAGRQPGATGLSTK